MTAETRRSPSELDVHILHVRAARAILLGAQTEPEILFGQVMWRTAEIRFVTYQLSIGAVVINADDSALEATIRAAEQLEKKLMVDTGIVATEMNSGLHSIQEDSIPRKVEAALKRLSQQLCAIIFVEDPSTHVALMPSTVRDWYVKLTFVMVTLSRAITIISRTTLSIPDEKGDNYKNFDEALVLPSLQVLRCKLGDVPELVRELPPVQRVDVGKLPSAASYLRFSTVL